MSAVYVLTFNLSTSDREAAEAAEAAARTASYAAEEQGAEILGVRSGPVYSGVVTARLRFIAEGDEEVRAISHRIECLPGLPPLDALFWRSEI